MRGAAGAYLCQLQDRPWRIGKVLHQLCHSVNRWADQIQRAGGLNVRIRVGLNSGEVVVRSIGSELHMDYTAVGQTTHLAARMEQMATPGTTVIKPSTLHMAERTIPVNPLGIRQV